MSVKINESEIEECLVVLSGRVLKTCYYSDLYTPECWLYKR